MLRYFCCNNFFNQTEGKMKHILVLMLLALTALFDIVSAQDGVILSDKTGWHKIGEKTVDFTRDRDEIHVFGANRFAALQVLVKDASIHLDQLSIAFETGENQVVILNSQIKASGESKLIDIEGKERNIKKIIFTYNTLLNPKIEKAQIEIWGLKTNADESNNITPSPAIVLSDKTGWQKIAETTVDFKAERDEIMILGANRFTMIRFKAKEAPIHIRNILFEFDKGENQAGYRQVKLKVGQESGDFILANSLNRAVKKISYYYNAAPNQRNQKGSIEIWGYKPNLAKADK